MSDPTDREALERRHLRVGWAWIAGFVLMGVALESLHGFKVGAYLDVGNATRRHMWTLAHAHGTLIGLIHVAYAFTLSRRPAAASRSASGALVVAGVGLPLGFFLGGVWFHGGDPGLGILLVPVGALALVWGVFSVAWALRRG